jgi:hypothetical protein
MIVNCKTAVTKLENKIEVDTNKTLLCSKISMGDSFKSRLELYSDSGITKHNVSTPCPTWHTTKSPTATQIKSPNGF